MNFRKYEFTVVPLNLRSENLFDTGEVLDTAQQEGMNPAPNTNITTRGFQVMSQELSKTAWHLPNELPYWESFMGASEAWVQVSCDA